MASTSGTSSRKRKASDSDEDTTSTSSTKSARPWTYMTLIPRIETEEKAVDFALELGILPRTGFCPNCHCRVENVCNRSNSSFASKSYRKQT